MSSDTREKNRPIGKVTLGRFAALLNAHDKRSGQAGPEFVVDANEVRRGILFDDVKCEASQHWLEAYASTDDGAEIASHARLLWARALITELSSRSPSMDRRGWAIPGVTAVSDCAYKVISSANRLGDQIGFDDARIGIWLGYQAVYITSGQTPEEILGNKSLESLLPKPD